MPELYLIDGNSYLYRAFYAIRGLSTSSGVPTNAVFGFTNMLLKILREKKPDYFAVAFDAPGPTKRHETFEDYKAHRPGMPDDLKVQVTPIKEIIAAFNIQTLETPGYEADDLLAALAREAETEGLDVFIVTSDKDMNQVVSHKVRLYDTMKDRITGVEDVIRRFGIEPHRFPEVIALMGDASDNIPGVPGIGEKTAVKLLKEFGSLDNLLDNVEKVGNARVRKAISENIESIRLSRELATVHADVPIGVPVSKLKAGEPEWEKLREYFHRFEFTSLIKLVPSHVPPDEQRADYSTVLDEPSFQEIVASLRSEFALDTETTSPSPMDASLVGISLSTMPGKACYIPLGHALKDSPRQLAKEDVLSGLKKVLEDGSARKVGHNIKYDFIIMMNEGIRLKGISFDTMLASYLLNPNRANHNLSSVAMDRLGIAKLTFRDVVGRDRRDFRDVPVKAATDYAAEDADVTLKLKHHLEPALEREGLTHLFLDLEMPLIEVLADMEMAGVRINLPLMESFSREMASELMNIQDKIYSLAGEEFNINSPKQLQEILFEKIGLQPLKKTKTGFSTDMDVLEQLALEHELPREIIEYRALSKLKNTYVDALPRLVREKTGRIHTSFNQTVTATGRLSSSEPNLQNIPVRGAWGKRIRQAFIADKGSLLLSADYSQIELRILAHLSRDEGLLEVFSNDGDIHTRTACELFGLSAASITADMRRRAKTVNFGIVYGISPFGLSRQLRIAPEEARQYIETYFSRHQGVRDYLDGLIHEATDSGHVTTILGRKRSIPELRSKNRTTRQLGERLATNSPIQGSAADIIKVAMLKIWRALRKQELASRMLLQVHDELLLEVPLKEEKHVTSLVRKEMESAARLDVPLKVDIGTGENWAEAHR